MTNTTAALTTASVVTFREGTAPYAQNAGRRFVVTELSVDNTGDEPRPVAWLVDVDDVALPASRQRRRSGYVADLTVIAIPVERITVEQVTTGDRIALNGSTDAAAFFTVKAIRDGLKSGIGLRTTDGEYVRLPFGYPVNRAV